jgi:hypothetical protein
MIAIGLPWLWRIAGVSGQKAAPVEPVEPVDPVEDPVDPLEPVDPVDPLELVDPVDPLGQYCAAFEGTENEYCNGIVPLFCEPLRSMVT